MTTTEVAPHDLEAIYAGDVEAQRARYRHALDAFRAAYGDGGEVLFFRAPGRANLIGEHTDYNHGFVFPLALDRDTVLIARPRADAQVCLANVEPAYHPIEFAIAEQIPPAPRGHWSNYARGPAQLLARQMGAPVRGFDGLIAGAPPHGVPRGAGVSSSSALTVAVAVALAHVNGWSPEGAALARFCAEAEWYVGTRGGIMDHFIGILARRDHAMFLDCRPGPDGGYFTRHVPLLQGYRLMVVDSGVHHQNARGEYNLRVAACRAGVALLRPNHPGITHLRDVQALSWADLEPLLPEQVSVSELAAAGIDLGDLPGLEPGTVLKVRARCRHVYTENERVLAAVTALEAGDVAEVGHLLDVAHASARDDYEVSCPEIEALVRAAHEVAGLTGARLTGAGWGGCIIALAPDAAAGEFERHVRSRYRKETGREANVFACHAGPGAGPVEAPSDL
jgi:galactokinase